jgi:hypothetical protein
MSAGTVASKGETGVLMFARNDQTWNNKTGPATHRATGPSHPFGFSGQEGVR